MNARLQEKLTILADAAKYDVSSSSSDRKRKNNEKGVGNTTDMGICYRYTSNGCRVPLLKILLTNQCIFDSAYSVSPKSNPVKRAAFTVEGGISLTINFYRRNYIEELFLNNRIFHRSDATMERLVRIFRDLRMPDNYQGYIYLKAILAVRPELIHEAGTYADHLSVNLELPSEQSLKIWAPEKSFSEAFKPMKQVKETRLKLNTVIPNQRKKLQKTWLTAGQSTQLLVGASPETDRHLLQLSESLYYHQQVKRAYYRAYQPLADGQRLVVSQVLALREHHLYRADLLLRLYGFSASELARPALPFLDLQRDTKLQYALLNRAMFPVEIVTASLELLLRIPGIGRRAVERILQVRFQTQPSFKLLQHLGLVMKRARYFILSNGRRQVSLEKSNQFIKFNLARAQKGDKNAVQLPLITFLGQAS